MSWKPNEPEKVVAAVTSASPPDEDDFPFLLVPPARAAAARSTSGVKPKHPSRELGERPAKHHPLLRKHAHGHQWRTAMDRVLRELQESRANAPHSSTSRIHLRMRLNRSKNPFANQNLAESCYSACLLSEYSIDVVTTQAEAPLTPRTPCASIENTDPHMPPPPPCVPQRVDPSFEENVPPSSLLPSL